MKMEATTEKIQSIKDNPKMLLVEHRIVCESERSTISKVIINNNDFGFVLEDDDDPTKVWGQTRIPGGLYEIKRRFEGRFAERHKKLWNHMSALQIMDVPNYDFILYHTGNTVEDTHGCMLCGSGYGINPKTKDYIITAGLSTPAYRKFYTEISKALTAGKQVFVHIDRTPPIK
jgi:hypothetical protein